MRKKRPGAAVVGIDLLEVEPIDGVSIDYTASDVDGDISSIQLNNYGTQDAVCSVTFTNGPESPRRRTVTVPAGKSTNTTVKFNRAIIKMRIALDCAPK